MQGILVAFYRGVMSGTRVKHGEIVRPNGLAGILYFPISQGSLSLQSPNFHIFIIFRSRINNTRRWISWEIDGQRKKGIKNDSGFL